ncbi:MAG: hypothetical protein JKX69_10545 [Rhodobacteraceae bacterium]|nr:hypothetical protein [Paracoccaceae bacterium]
MSGICGIIRLDGHAPAAGDVAAICGKMQVRGPDGTTSWLGAEAGFGYCRLASTTDEQMPVHDTQTGAVLVGDIRLDNRAGLLASLGCDPALGDGALVMLAWRRWGAACLDHLMGDFAFAIWQPQRRALFLARDQIGMRQLNYTFVEGKFIAFATEAEPLLALDDVPLRLNPTRVADFLDGGMEHADLTSTFFEGIYRLPPAHCLTFEGQKPHLRRYWQLEPVAELVLDSDAAYEAAFAKVFEQALQDRLRSVGAVGAMLSGGMDSGTIAALGGRLLAKTGAKLPSFSAINNADATCKETRAALAAMRAPGLAPHKVDLAKIEQLRPGLEAHLRGCGEPFDANMVMINAVYLTAKQAGMTVVLDGAGGDLVLGEGRRVERLIARGQFSEAWAESRASTRFWGPDPEPEGGFARAVYRAIVPRWLRMVRRAGLRDRRRETPADWLLSPALLARIGYANRRPPRAAPRTGIVSFCQERINAITSSGTAISRERYDRVAGAHGIEPRDPFMDLRVIRFCLSLPEAQVHKDGWPKMILRRVTQGLLPDETRWRRGRSHLGWAFTQALAAQSVPPVVDYPRFRTSLVALLGNDSPSAAGRSKLPLLDDEQIIELTAFQHWLDRMQELTGKGLQNEGLSHENDQDQSEDH